MLHILGDVHLGRRFRNGVPLHRKGERERMLFEQFQAELAMAAGVQLHVQVGDLFDKISVPFAVVLDAARAYLDAARSAPHCDFVVIRGNHDASRDASVRSAFDVFAALVEGQDNIHVVADEPLSLRGAAFIPWHPFRTAAEMAALVTEPHEAVFGHWDVAGNGDNLVPVAELLRHGKVYTGHDHRAREERVGGLPVQVVGSMQPLAHGEDNGEMYVTLDLADIADQDFRQKCVRVRLRPGEQLPDIDCLQLTHLRVTEEGEPAELNVEFEGFDMLALFDEAFAGNPLGGQVKTKFQELRDVSE